VRRRGDVLDLADDAQTVGGEEVELVTCELALVTANASVPLVAVAVDTVHAVSVEVTVRASDAATSVLATQPASTRAARRARRRLPRCVCGS
jgi:hypothetical protein